MKNIALFRSSTLYWIAFLIVSIGSGFFVYHYFPKSFAIVDLDVKLHRNEAFSETEKIAQKANLQPLNGSKSAEFISDTQVQYYAELEAGGVEEFKKLLHDSDYTPYYWSIRLFKEEFIPEAHIYLTPNGNVYGFSQKLPFDEPGAALSSEDAHILAASKAATAWNVDLKEYALVEAGESTNPAGRIDHTFTYEHKLKKLKDAPYRIRLKITGDQLTEVKRFIKVPETFFLKYQEMRSANTTIASIANQFYTILYILIGCIIGIIFLWRRKEPLAWKSAATWAGLLVFGNFLNNWNSFQLQWNHYETLSPMFTFIAHFTIHAFSKMITSFGFYFIGFLAAEGLTRFAFKHHPDFWHSISPKGIGSKGILQRLLAGYLFVPIDLAYIVATYFLGRLFLGWWSPADAFYDPNILAYYAPWLAPITRSFAAGFGEELLFRAIPLAGAATLGKIFGRQRLWIGGAIILQAIIFGAVHANYPSQPAYARLAELILPSLFWAYLFLRYGLITGTILHIVYDVFWFALPLFAATGFIITKTLVIVLTFLPLMASCWKYLKNMQQKTVFNSDRKINIDTPIPNIIAYDSEHLPAGKPLHVTLLAPFCIIGLLLWARFTRFQPDFEKLQTNRIQTTVETAKVLAATEEQLAKEPWHSYSYLTEGQIDFTSDAQKPQNHLQQRFIWQTQKSFYTPLLTAGYLPQQHWATRTVRFSGDLLERANQYFVSFSPDGSPESFYHALPEEMAGASLSEQQARSIATEFLTKKMGIDLENIKAISAIPQKRPHRTDWTFLWQDLNFKLSSGQARILIWVAGNQVANAYKFIFVPQEWARSFYKNEEINLTIRDIIALLMSILSIIALAVLLLPLSTPFNYHFFLKTAFAFLVLQIIHFINNWPIKAINFSTISPYYNQLFTLLGWTSIGMVRTAAQISLIATILYSIGKRTRTAQKNRLFAVIQGCSIGALAIGARAYIGSLFSSIKPLLPTIVSAQTYSALVSNVTEGILQSSPIFLQILAGLFVLNKLTNRWTRNKVLGTIFAMCALCGVLSSGPLADTSLLSLFTLSFLAGILAIIGYIILFRFDHKILMYAIATCYMLPLIQDAAFNAFPGAWVAKTGMIVAIFMTAIWCDLISTKS